MVRDEDVVHDDEDYDEDRVDDELWSDMKAGVNLNVCDRRLE